MHFIFLTPGDEVKISVHTHRTQHQSENVAMNNDLGNYIRRGVECSVGDSDQPNEKDGRQSWFDCHYGWVFHWKAYSDYTINRNCEHVVNRSNQRTMAQETPHYGKGRVSISRWTCQIVVVEDDQGQVNEANSKIRKCQT